MSVRSTTFRLLLSLFISASVSTKVRSVNGLSHLNAGTTTSRADESTSILIRGDPKCDLDCSGAVRQYFCASNGRTLDSQCKVDRARCHDRMLEFTPGKCLDSKRCQQLRNHTLRIQSKAPRQAHIPICEPDGSYSRAQCDAFFGYCWCVTSLGTIIRNSTAQLGTLPDCVKSKHRKKNKCKNVPERVEFARKLRDLIMSDFKSRSQSKNPLQEAVNAKHAKYDKNRDGKLSKREFNKLIKKYRRKFPKPCKKALLKHCDYDNDKKISQTEWKICLGVPLLPNLLIENETRNQPVAPAPKPPNLLPEPSEDNEITPDPSPRGPDAKAGTEPQRSHTCREIRLEVLKSRIENAIVPRCEGVNQEYWAPVQCHKKAGYCWCALRENGRHISHTSLSMEIGQPDCDKLTASSLISVPILGCPTKTKVKFLRQIQDLLMREMLQALGTVDSMSSDPSQTIKERAARWYFDHLDEDSDGFLTYHENIKFKKLLSGNKLPKKCMRKFPTHCDRNRDKKTTLDELIACLEVRMQERSPLRYNKLSDTINQLKTTDDPEYY